ncbi:PDZ domain-containing protein [Ekhidna sp.]|uniref:S41 family peptidase n=1 Tax=Ekhidna sp. TaxID=2608089 RepID=UPI003299CF93
MNNNLIVTLLLFFLGSEIAAQINARMLREPDVSQTNIVFVYAGDIWTVPKTGGTANKLSSPMGEEKFPKFSPDGSQIAFTANYDGNWDVYVIPANGGIPKRLTTHGGFDQVLEWHPDGSKILFASSRESGRQRFSQFYEVNINGGLPKKLVLPYGSLGSYSPDGTSIAFNFKSRINRTWKRYKGGWAPDIWTYDLATNTSVNITNNASSDEFPMWGDGKIFYSSDNGPNSRYNLWSYDLASGSNTQITDYSDFDIHFPSIGPEEIVFENAGRLYLMDLSTQQSREVDIEVITDQLSLTEKMVDVGDNMNWFDVSPDGKRLIVSARGDVFSVPSENGVTRNITNSDGAHDRLPSWSPDGKKIAYWSDKSGEYQLMIYNTESQITETLTKYTSGFRYQLFWSPDSKKLAFVNQAMEFNYFDLNTRQTFKMDEGLFMFHGALRNFSFSWSSDSKWIAYSKDNANYNRSIHLYDTQSKQGYKVTGEFYNDFSPTFDPDNNYLFFLTNRNVSPVYSDFDNTFIYPNSTIMAAVPLTQKTDNLLKPKNDEVEIKKEDADDENGDKKKGKKKGDKEESSTPVKIDIDGFERRIILLPIDAGNYGGLEAVSGKIVFMQFPNSGSADRSSAIKYYDIKDREVKTLMGNANGFEIAANGEKIAVSSGSKVSVVSISESQNMDKPVSMSNMKMTINPMNEWKQIFREAWRLERDYFYDKEMHGLDWVAVGEQYEALIAQCVTRWDVNYVLGELIGELNASHTYRGGGDQERSSNVNVGYLGIDWKKSNNFYQVGRIVRGASWDAEVRSPLDETGVNINAGDYILAVNGVPIDGSKDPFASFQGLANETVELTVNNTASMTNSRKVLVKTMPSESRLRHLEWIEANRKKVDEMTNGRAGYIYVRSTGIDGQNELIRQFTGQLHKEALIIDERFNSGGQIPDRFIEMLNRKPLAYWAVRDGETWSWPPAGNFGPKVMLINGWSGSGGDAFPDYFRKAGLGPLIGSRTWGGLIGISGAPSLIDGGGVTVPTFRMFDPSGEWFKEGHGVDPDIEVKENPGQLAQGNDAQLQRAIDYINEQLKNYQGKPMAPTKEDR